MPDVTSVFKGVTTPLRELNSQIDQQGWELTAVNFSGGEYKAKAKNLTTGETLERTGPTDQTAAGNLLLAVTRRNFMRTKAQFKLGSWSADWTNQLQEIATAYAEAPVYDPKAVGAWKELADDSVRRARVLEGQLEIEVVPDPEPYASQQEMCEDIHKNKKFKVSSANCEHPVWTVEQNIAFRIVHDVMGHCVSGGDFGWLGENKACQAHFPLLSTEAQRALFVECIAQTAYAAFYRSFGPQKVTFLDDYLAEHQERENPAAHNGVHPSQSLAPTQMPGIPPSPAAQTPNQPGFVAPHLEAPGLTPVLTSLPPLPPQERGLPHVEDTLTGDSWYNDPDSIGWVAPDRTGTRPVVYHPDTHTVYVGADGQHHSDVVDQQIGLMDPDDDPVEWSSDDVGQTNQTMIDMFGETKPDQYGLQYGRIENGKYQQWGPGHEDIKAALYKRGLISSPDGGTTTPQRGADGDFVFGKTATTDVVDPNWEYQTGIEPNTDHHAIQHYGDPLEHDKVADTASLIDTNWAAKDENNPSDRALMKQAISNAFRVVLLSPRKDLRWNAVHYQDIAHVPADVTDPKVYWDTLEEKRKQHNVARGRDPEAHLIYWKPRQQYYQLVAMMNPDLPHDKAIEKADREIWKMRVQETERIEQEDVGKSPEKQRSADEVERRVNEAIAKRLKLIVEPEQEKHDVPDQLQMVASEEYPEWVWQQGRCGTYACALQRLVPNLGFGVAGRTTDDGWWPDHFFAHDDQYAYDSLGRHPLPYYGVEGQFDVSELNHNPTHWGVPEEEAGPEGPEPGIQAAMAHAKRWLPLKISAKGQYDIFTGEPADFYGAWMGSHLKAIAQISQHSEELLDAALEDVREHDGTGHHFRATALKLGISGVGPKVASFAWLLLQPMTSQLATIDTHMMDVLGHDYAKEMNNRDYFKFERELQAGRDAAGYSHVPLGQFQWGMWDHKRTGPGTHQDHSAMRVLDPVPHNTIDWHAHAPQLKGEDWAKQAPAWWQATQPARDQVAQHWDETMATQGPVTAIPWTQVKHARTATIPGEYGTHDFKYWWDKEGPYYGGEERLIADYAAATKMTKKKFEKWMDDHKEDIRSNFEQFKKRALKRFEGSSRDSKTATKMRRLKNETGLTTTEIWQQGLGDGSDSDAPTDHTPDLSQAPESAQVDLAESLQTDTPPKSG